MKLHLGCGNKILKGYVNVDIRPETGCDVIDDVELLDKFKDNSADEIYACHVLEHFGRHEYMFVLQRWFDVLKPGGLIRISVPDLEAVFYQYANKNFSLSQLMGFIYGGQTYNENYHYVGFDFNTLKEDLELIGFRNISKWDWKLTDHADVDDYSQAYLPHMEKESGVLMSLNIQAFKS